MPVRWLWLLALGAVACSEADAAPFSRGRSSWPFSAANVTPSFSNNYAIDMKSGQTLTTPDANDLDCTTAMTVSVWIQRKAVGSPYIARRWGAVAGDQSWELRVDSTSQSQLLTHFSSTAIGVRTNNAAITTNTWTHVALVYDGTATNLQRVNIYEDGTELTYDVYSGSIPTTLKNSSQTFDLHTVVTTEMWFDEFAFWCSALSSAQISAIYHAGHPADLSSYTPILWYRFENTGSTSITDAAGNGHTGTYTGSGADYTGATP